MITNQIMKRSTLFIVKNVTTAILSLLLFSNCSKDDEVIYFPPQAEGYYKLVSISPDEQHFIDSNENGKREDFYTEFTTGNNLFIVDDPTNFLQVKSEFDVNKNKTILFEFAVPGFHLLKQNEVNAIEQKEGQRWKVWFSNKVETIPYEENILAMNEIKLSSLGYQVRVLSTKYSNKILMVRVHFLNQSQDKNEAGGYVLDLVYKFINNNRESAIKQSSSVKLENRDVVPE
ncbi:hypothetical protein K5X82_14865 [Halosquirtibacter xylanolyticus]|uniref:hypothetical protein n=1 Tax=Halosquirtibacter xylanolyticus TaxID=3374599 RepID=UPI003749651F|nr:hypothetical protein K5X82_14865 [Prolixibacteraceae bacterium]